MSLHSELSSRADLDEFSSLAFNFFVPRACSCGINCAFPIAAVATSVNFTEMLVDAVAVWATTPALTEDFAGAVLLSASVSVTVSVTSAALWKDFVADTTFPAPVDFASTSASAAFLVESVAIPVQVAAERKGFTASVAPVSVAVSIVSAALMKVFVADSVVAASVDICCSSSSR